jgi:cytochrome c biogenesis protein CcmG/thiol:disulfide interchange protein DsbE
MDDLGITPDESQVGGWSRGRIAGVAIGSLLALSLIALLTIGLIRGRENPLIIDRALANGEEVAAPRFELPVLVPADGVGPEGSRVSLESLKGRPIVLNLWASWCAPCRDEAPILERIAQRYRAAGVIVLGVNVRDSSNDAREFVRRYGTTFPSLRDGGDDTKDLYETRQLPETFIIDPDLVIRSRPIRGELTPAIERRMNEYLDTLVTP